MNENDLRDILMWARRGVSEIISRSGEDPDAMAHATDVLSRFAEEIQRGFPLGESQQAHRQIQAESIEGHPGC